MSFLSRLMDALEQELTSTQDLPDAQQLRALELEGPLGQYPVSLHETCGRIRSILHSICTVKYMPELALGDELRACVARFNTLVPYSCYPVPAGRKVQTLIANCRVARAEKIERLRRERGEALARMNAARAQLLEAEEQYNRAREGLSAMEVWGHE